MILKSATIKADAHVWDILSLIPRSYQSCENLQNSVKKTPQTTEAETYFSLFYVLIQPASQRRDICKVLGCNGGGVGADCGALLLIAWEKVVNLLKRR